MSEKSGELLGVVAPDPGTAVTVTSLEPARQAVQEAVEAIVGERPRLWALEAGAGRRIRLALPEDAYVVGVDRDPAALARNGRLDERIVADLAEFNPRATGFDVITSWYGLELLPDPATVLERMAAWAATDGVVVIAVPNVRSPRALLAKLTPPRTAMRWAISPAALRRRFAAHGFRPTFEVFFEDPRQAATRRRLGLVRNRWQLAQAAVRLLSFGVLDAARTEYAVVFRRPLSESHRALTCLLCRRHPPRP